MLVHTLVQWAAALEMPVEQLFAGPVPAPIGPSEPHELAAMLLQQVPGMSQDGAKRLALEVLSPTHEDTTMRQ